MCGIVGYVGREQAAPILLDGLRRLEYRGYDSAGVAFFTAQGAVKTLRTTERVERLKQMAAAETDGGTAIAHTRWATHGGVTLQNAHPHTVGRVTLVHNGIIENYERLRAELGYAPVSGTDTEIAAALIDGEYGADPVRALEAAAARLEAFIKTLPPAKKRCLAAGETAPEALFADRLDGQTYLRRTDEEARLNVLLDALRSGK